MQLAAPKAAVSDGFGSSLALDGSTLFVGAAPAAVHVFTKQGTMWTYSSTVDATTVPMPPAATPPPPATPPAAGAPPAAPPAPNVARVGAIAASGDWLLIGKEVAGGRGRGGPITAGAGGRGGTAPAQPAGAVFAFKRGANGQYAYHSTIASAADATATVGDRFGSAVAVTGTTALIGASGQNAGAGVVHEFAVDADAWKSVRTFAPIGAQGTTAAFGSLISTNGTQAFVAAPGDAGGYGSVYVFGKLTQQGGRGGAPAPQAAGAAAPPVNIQWVELNRLAAPAAGRTDRFGTSIAASEREVWVGPPGAVARAACSCSTASATGFQVDGLRLLGPSWTDPIAAGASVSVRGSVAAVGATGANRMAAASSSTSVTPSATGEQPMMTTHLMSCPPSRVRSAAARAAARIEVFDCGAADLQSFLPPSHTDARRTLHAPGSSLWGWSDARPRPGWALVRLRDGTTFVDITNPTMPRAVAYLPLTEGARPSAWREMKTYKDHAFIVSDGSGPHGIQIFDLGRLRTMKPQPNGRPQLVAADFIYRDVNSVHDMVINEESGFAYPVGSSGGGNTCGGGLHMIDIHEPKNPKFVGCFADTETGRQRTGYIHDAQCVNYKGPDKRYKGHEICIGSNETMLSLQDVTDKKAPKVISHAAYPKVGYTHQGWLTDDHKYFYLDDELDETGGLVDKTRTLIWDFTDLENPKLVKEYLSKEAASDHNQYVKGDLLYQANYRAGLRVLSIKDPINPKEIAYFDTDPFRPNTAGFNGAEHLSILQERLDHHQQHRAGTLCREDGGQMRIVARIALGLVFAFAIGPVRLGA